MNWLTGIAAGILLAFALAGFRDIGYQAGYRDGHRAADDWWKQADIGTDEARQQIWREEPKKGRWV